MIDTAQSLGSAYHVVIEKVFLCSGLDGYVPKFDPSSNDFGCLADSTNLLYRFKILVSFSTISTYLYKTFSKVSFCENMCWEGKPNGKEEAVRRGRFEEPKTLNRNFLLTLCGSSTRSSAEQVLPLHGLFPRSKDLSTI